MEPAIFRDIQEKYQRISPSLTERTRRLWCAVEARQLGWDGVRVVHQATGGSMPTIRQGVKELEQPIILTPCQSRIQGGGRKKLTERYTDLPDAHDIVQFATNSIRCWWTRMGHSRFPQTTRLLITADSGGSVHG